MRKLVGAEYESDLRYGNYQNKALEELKKINMEMYSERELGDFLEYIGLTEKKEQNLTYERIQKIVRGELPYSEM